MTQSLDDGDLRKIVVFLAQRFGAVCQEFVPRLGRAVATTEKKVKFSVDVTMQIGDDGIIEAYLIPKAPKIPTEDLDPIPFMLALGRESQLELAFEGGREMLSEAMREPPPMTQEQLEEDAYQPSDNVVRLGLEDTA